MSHVKSGGATRQSTTRPGKRRGVKVYGSQTIKTGQIILRQVGTKTRPGVGVGMGRERLHSLRNEGWNRQILYPCWQAVRLSCL